MRLLRPSFFALLFLAGAPLPAAAQAVECGELTELQCGLLAVARETWNERFGEVVRMTGLKYLGPARFDGKAEAAAEMLERDGKAWIPDYREGKLRGVELIDPGPRDPKENERYRIIQRIASQSDHAVELQWQQGGNAFSTTALALRSYPHLYGDVISNVMLQRDSNSCFHKHFQWLWGSERGEVLVDLVKVNSDVSVCKRVLVSWFSFGNVEAKHGDIEYAGGLCRMTYAWGVTTPLATLAFDDAGFKFEVSGIGSNAVGGGDCVVTAR